MSIFCKDLLVGFIPLVLPLRFALLHTHNYLPLSHLILLSLLLIPPVPKVSLSLRSHHICGHQLHHMNSLCYNST